MLPACTAAYVVMNYFGRQTNVISLILAAVMELAFTFGLVMLCTKGDIWCNYLRCMVNVYCTTMLASIPCMLNKDLSDALTILMQFKECNPVYAVIIAADVILCGWICALIFRKIYNKKSRLTNYQARIVVVAAFLLIIPAYLLKHNVIKEKLAIKDNTLGDVLYVILSFMLSAIICALFVYIPTIIIKRTTELDNEKRKEYIKKQGAYYKLLVDSNVNLQMIKDEFEDKLNDEWDNIDSLDEESAINLKEKLKAINLQPLSGDILIDAMLDDFNKQASDNNIIFEVSIENFSDFKYRDELIGVITELTKQCMSYAADAGKKQFVKLILRRKKGMVVMEVSFAKGKAKLYYNDMYSFDHTKSFIDEVKGSIIIEDEGLSGRVCVLIPAIN